MYLLKQISVYLNDNVLTDVQQTLCDVVGLFQCRHTSSGAQCTSGSFLSLGPIIAESGPAIVKVAELLSSTCCQTLREVVVKIVWF